MKSLENISDLIVLSTIDYSSQDEQSSLIFSRIAQENNVYFFQPPQIFNGEIAAYAVEINEHEICLIQPFLPKNVSVFERLELYKAIVHQIILTEDIFTYSIWLDSPKNVPLIRSLSPQKVIHKWNPELQGTYPELEEELKQYTDLALGPRRLNQAALEAVGMVNIWDKSIHHFGLHQ